MARAIIHLLQNPDKTKAMESEGTKAAPEKFTTEAMVKAHENLYKSLIANCR
jgi:glycosyltransferase involved in cell wall biosynthesis